MESLQERLDKIISELPKTIPFNTRIKVACEYLEQVIESEKDLDKYLEQRLNGVNNV